MYLNSFVPKTKHNCGCISQVCIYKGIFRFWSALCGLLGDKYSIASSCLVHKTSTVHMAFFNSLRGAKQLLREANNPRNGAKQILRDSTHLLRETKQILPDSQQLLREANNPRNGAKEILRDSTHLLRETKQILPDSKQLLREANNPSNGAIQIETLGKVTENLLWETNVINSHNIAFNGIESENFVDETCAITRNIRQANHILAMYMIIELLKNKFILKSTNYFETNNASTKIVPRIDYKKGYSYRVSNQPKESGCSENHRHSLSCLHSVCHKPRDRQPSRISLKKVIKLLKCRKFRNLSGDNIVTNMSLQGTWANHIIIQAVADAMNLKIHIIESDSNYREITLVQPANATSDIRSIYIGHMGQMHYVSTCNSFEQDSNHRNANNIQQTIPNDSVQNEFSEIVTDKDTGIIKSNSNQTRKRDRAAYMRKYRKLNNSPEKRLKRNEYLKKYREMNASPEKRSKTNEYLKKYREINASPEKRLKTNEYQREYRQGHKTSMEFAINRFHEIVNQGPLYVCTCCDQLWYK